jgi:hypothetical protein
LLVVSPPTPIVPSRSRMQIEPWEETVARLEVFELPAESDLGAWAFDVQI